MTVSPPKPTAGAGSTAMCSMARLLWSQGNVEIPAGAAPLVGKQNPPELVFDNCTILWTKNTITHLALTTLLSGQLMTGVVATPICRFVLLMRKRERCSVATLWSKNYKNILKKVKETVSLPCGLTKGSVLIAPVSSGGWTGSLSPLLHAVDPDSWQQTLIPFLYV